MFDTHQWTWYRIETYWSRAPGLQNCLKEHQRREEALGSTWNGPTALGFPFAQPPKALQVNLVSFVRSPILYFSAQLWFNMQTSEDLLPIAQPGLKVKVFYDILISFPVVKNQIQFWHPFSADKLSRCTAFSLDTAQSFFMYINEKLCTVSVLRG